MFSEFMNALSTLCNEGKSFNHFDFCILSTVLSYKCLNMCVSFVCNSAIIAWNRFKSGLCITRQNSAKKLNYDFLSISVLNQFTHFDKQVYAKRNVAV